jgi:two-component system, chemotaxis family, CheB/CheR fusion protein
MSEKEQVPNEENKQEEKPKPEEQQKTKNNFPIVGIGASAGGLGALEAFFSGIPANVSPGVAFVVIQHLDPNYKSMLTDLLGRYTNMPVYEIMDGMNVNQNCVYIIPPNSNLTYSEGLLHYIFKTF